MLPAVPYLLRAAAAAAAAAAGGGSAARIHKTPGLLGYCGRSSVDTLAANMDSIPKPMRLMAAGACAGTVTKTATAPLDRIKVLLQVQAMSPDEKVATKYNGIVGSVRQVLAEEGFLALWRGAPH